MRPGFFSTLGSPKNKKYLAMTEKTGQGRNAEPQQ
jgi:hypothetical protein